ncbi:hypothetical protein BP6252_11517 [Coleophoma cylindrospora]|uniref:Uncharacterized protein n=1 Tax=Coleophoma cylindrospora TaxID=1849047 RepID=A0A3D8QKV8_9HELO|nr:hypothetical protein BP6252_11517 [Coleophoma cylindrospora]
MGTAPRSSVTERKEPWRLLSSEPAVRRPYNAIWEPCDPSDNAMSSRGILAGEEWRKQCEADSLRVGKSAGVLEKGHYYEAVDQRFVVFAA